MENLNNNNLTIGIQLISKKKKFIIQDDREVEIYEDDKIIFINITKKQWANKTNKSKIIKSFLKKNNLSNNYWHIKDYWICVSNEISENIF